MTEFLGLDFATLDHAEVLAWLAARDAATQFAYVVTPNVDHMVRLVNETAEVHQAYSGADLCLCDSRVLARLARLGGLTLPVVPGSDLVEESFARVLQPGDAVCLIGGRAADAAQLRLLYPTLRIIHHDPPMGLRANTVARGAAVAAAAAAGARMTLIAVGSPQQELLAQAMREDPAMRGVALCVGASVEFLTGRQHRAPRVWRRLGIEWAWRLATNPRRLARRYLIDGPAIFPMVWRWRRERSR